MKKEAWERGVEHTKGGNTINTNAILNAKDDSKDQVNQDTWSF